MERTKETLEARVRETPLVDRLKECRQRIGKMCSEGRPPRMCIPVQHDDDDFFISTTLSDAQATVEALQRERDEWERKCRDLCQAHGVLLIEHHDVKKALDAERERRLTLERVTQEDVDTIAGLKRDLAQLQAPVLALPDCPGEIKVYPPAVGVICGTYDVRYDFHLESGSFQSIRLAMFHDECEADTYADLLRYRATLDATTPATTKT